MWKAVVVTKFIPPTDKRGAQMTARVDGNRFRCSYDHELDLDQNHRSVAAKLVQLMGWAPVVLVTGSMPNQNQVHCIVPGIGPGDIRLNQRPTMFGVAASSYAAPPWRAE